ncbi:hypothetical protein [Lysinibacillus sp. NPDC047702]|uniref:hypothetical protein n=1 Tax=unclassified Lysinibacillus TaxID=2636778 RepID=UPI003CFD3568
MTRNPYDYYITDEEYEFAEARGISQKTLDYRIRRLGWSKSKALNTPVKKQRKYPKHIMDKVKENNIHPNTFRWRVQYGWDIERACTEPTLPPNHPLRRSGNVEKRRKYPIELVLLAEKNGISYQTFRRRVKSGMDMHTAAVTPLMSKDESLAKARQKSSFYLGNEIFWNIKKSLRKSDLVQTN